MKRHYPILIAICAFLVGCTTDISGDSHYQTGFLARRVYVLQQDVLAIVVRDWPTRGIRYLILLAPKDRDQVAYHGEELVSIPKGTRIYVHHVLLAHDIENGTQLDLYARIDSGPYSGKTADLQWISKTKKLNGGGMFSHIIIRDPSFLKEAR